MMFNGRMALICPSAKNNVPETGDRSLKTGVLSVEFRIIVQLTETRPWVPPFLTMVMPSNLGGKKVNYKDLYCHFVLSQNVSKGL